MRPSRKLLPQAQKLSIFDRFRCRADVYGPKDFPGANRGPAEGSCEIDIDPGRHPESIQTVLQLTFRQTG